MIVSEQQLFSKNQAITGDAASTNYIDLGATGTPPLGNQLVRDIGKGQPVHLEAIVTEAFNTLTSLDIQVQVDDNTSFSSAKTVLTINVPLASLVVGYTIPIQFLPNGVDERYLRLFYNVNGTDPTTGQIYAGISMGRQTNIN